MVDDWLMAKFGRAWIADLVDQEAGSCSGTAGFRAEATHK
jgi:hypothetical protein